METTAEVLVVEIGLLNDLTKDYSFDQAVLDDAKALIEIKNKSIIDLGGSPVVFEEKVVVGITTEDLLDRVTKQLKAIYPFRNSEKIGAKYRTLNKVFKLKSGITFEEYKEKGNKFFYGGAVSNYSTNAMSNLMKTNMFFYLRETQNDAVLKYTKPENSVLFQVLLPNDNVAYAVAYPVDKNTTLDFYQDEELTQSLNLTYSFSATFNDESFKEEYDKMMKELYDVEKKYY